jgi:uncharacterized protein
MMRARTVALAFALSALVVSSGHSIATGQTYNGLTLQELYQRQPHGPSFDCAAKPLSHVEALVCSNPELAKLDMKLNDEYAETTFESYHSLSIVASQTAWLRNRNACTTTACLRESYLFQLAFLRDEERSIERRRKVMDDTYRGARFNVPSALRARVAQIAALRCVGDLRQIDLGDGARSLVATSCHVCLDGEGVVILHPEGSTYRPLLKIPECYVSSIFEGLQDERSHGLRRIVTLSREAADEHSLSLFDFDGAIYRHRAELVETNVTDDHGYVELLR